MTWLYTDTTDHLVYGLLDKNFEWMDYFDISSRKSSSELHFSISEMCSKNNVDPANLSGHLFAAGPGSYTGMRVSEGMAQVFEWQDISIYSFYHFEVPGMLDKHEGIWFSEAFKGEFFVYDINKKSSKLYLEKDFVDLVSSFKGPLYTHFQADRALEILPDDTNPGFTGLLVKEDPKAVLSKVAGEEKRQKPLYYRAEDKEFKPSNK